MDSQLRMLQKFSNFWSNVSFIKIGANVPVETVESIKYSIEHVQGEKE